MKQIINKKMLSAAANVIKLRISRAQKSAHHLLKM